MARRTKEEAQATREGILDAAEECFREKGLSGTSLEAEARLAALKSGQNPALPGAQQQSPAQITDGDDAAVNAAFEALKAQGQPVGEEKSSY
mgnify:CR=1 FL=1